MPQTLKCMSINTTKRLHRAATSKYRPTSLVTSFLQSEIKLLNEVLILAYLTNWLIKIFQKFVTNTLEKGDRNKAMRKLRVPPLSGLELVFY